METLIFEFVGLYNVPCMCFRKTCILNTTVFLRRWSKHTVTYTISYMLPCENVTNSGVFTPLLVWVLQKHRQPLLLPSPCLCLVPGSIAGFAKPNNKLMNIRQWKPTEAIQIRILRQFSQVAVSVTRNRTNASKMACGTPHPQVSGTSSNFQNQPCTASCS